jgi:sulfofructose kinase
MRLHAVAVGLCLLALAHIRRRRLLCYCPRKLLCLGHATVDTILRVPKVVAPPAKVLASGIKQTAGGMATNAAAAAARLGASVVIFSRVGDDGAGEFYRKDLDQEGARLDLSRVQIVAGASTSVSSILVDNQGERLVVPYNDPKLDSAEALCAVQAEIDRFLAEGDVISCLVDVRWPDGAEILLRATVAHGLLAMLDADVASAGIIRRLAPLATHVIFSEDGLRIFVGEAAVQLLPGEDPGDPAEQRDRLTRQLLAKACSQLPDAQMVGVTLGARGFLWWAEGESLGDLPGANCGDSKTERGDKALPTFWQMAAPSVHAIDTLGAGDVFHAALAVALSGAAASTTGTAEGGCVFQGEQAVGGDATKEREGTHSQQPPSAAAACFACTAAALKCTRAGGRLGAPYRREVRDWIAAAPAEATMARVANARHDRFTEGPATAPPSSYTCG